MRRSRIFIPTMKENPADVVAISHQLMLRAGLVKMLSAGIYSYLPLGWKSAQKAMNIIRDEMENIGAQELYLPALNPISVWDETGRSRDFGEEMFRLKDRKGQGYCLAPTHEEIICSIARGNIRSWRDLPQSWFQIQLKFRDEPRPRGGLLRVRQFLMKDSYSLDRDEAGLDKSYEAHRIAYERIFQRCGLDYFIVGASSGLMGKGQSQEFMIESEAGEDEVAKCDRCDYAANVEVATSAIDHVADGEQGTLTEVSTPDQKTVADVAKFLNIPPSRLVKTLVYMGPHGLIMALLSGEDDLSEAKLSTVVGGPIRPAYPKEVRERIGADVGFLGPQGDHGLLIYADQRLEDVKGLASGANKNDYHVIGLDFGRDVVPDEYVDLRMVREDESCPVCGNGMRVVRVVELGHVFKLGTKYSTAMGANYLDEDGKERPIVMGSYGIGVERILAAAIESRADEHGIRWNSALTPVDIIVIPLNNTNEDVVKQAEDLYHTLTEHGYDVILDDRNARAGVKMKDADLIGAPAQVIVSPRNIESGMIEIKSRWLNERQLVKPEDILSAVGDIVDECWPDVLHENGEE